MNVGIPPRSLNHRLPAAEDAPTATPASSLLNPFAISRQNSRSTSRRSDGFPGDFIGALPVNSLIHPAGLPINTAPTITVLRAPVESSQIRCRGLHQTLDAHDVLASVGSTGDAYDNSMAESFVDSFKTELVADRVWCTRSQLELAIVEYVGWFNDERLHENLGARPPREIEELYALKTRPTITTS